jgi:2-dehydro-3-deoxyphosphogalactonate aldolase
MHVNVKPQWPVLRRGLVAILRGIRPHEAVDAIEVLVAEGFEAAEIPLNSPDPFESISRATGAFGERCLIGAGTVLTPDDVDRLAECGGRLIVSPNFDSQVIAQAEALGLVSMPGVFTASEALLALRAGASALKFFPASVLGPSGIAAIRAILPPETIIGAVGGVSETSFAAYAKAGVKVFGLGTSLYRPGDKADDVRAKARTAIAAYDAAFLT